MWGVAIVVINAVRVENFSAARLVGLINQEGKLWWRSGDEVGGMGRKDVGDCRLLLLGIGMQ